MNTPVVTPTGATPPGDGERDPVLLAAYRALDSVAPSPGLQPRAVILGAAQRQAAFHAHRSLWQRRGFLVGLGVVAAAAAATLAVQVIRRPPGAANPSPPAAIGTPLAVAPAAAVPADGGVTTANANAVAGPAAGPAPSAAGVAAAAGLVLPPPRGSALSAVVAREAGKRFQSLLDSNDERSWVAGLLLDHNRKVLRVADPVPLPAPTGPEGDPRLANEAGFAAYAFGLRERDYDNGIGTLLNGGPQQAAGHPHLMVWAFTLRDDAELQTEAVVRAAVLAHFNQQLPARPSSGDVALLTAVMTAEGAIDRFELLYRQPPASGLADEAFDADRDKRFSRLGLGAEETGKAGSLRVASEELPGGKPGGLVIVSYAWPKAVARARATTRPDGGIDEVAAVAMLKALFTTTQLLDDSDGQMAWVLLDHAGHALRSGRAPANDKNAPALSRLTDAYPGIRIDGSMSGSYRDPDARGQHYDAQFFWLAADSPPPR